uniref:succinate dehydrogenase subunit 3 n=1 Tax=Grateloupia turuturu TaxID=118375 RepID=UPI00279F867C|nr:succinate dehydrogenase subunit 3 [Grateloupia turuturu]YP_010986426.1 succinate dehydrogenase cytochrome b560 subunit [Pachymeniopsis lanceolata]WIM51234.1 succinate dehydrogenase subunit 3 [Grateloupia turuturu]WOL37394.1 succinate dehydrogenase cytochrome b560 subunit [Pachymeniopsis lanceolata]
MSRNYNYNRPISPHLSVYLPQVSSMFSIWHRLSGVLLITGFLIFLLVLNLAIQLDSKIFLLFIFLPTWFLHFFYLTYFFIFMYHALNGLRHITWDLFLFLEVKELNLSAIILVLLLFFILIKTIITL